MPERTVSVYRFQQLWREDDPAVPGCQRAAFVIECSAGTYVRSLISDLGDAYCEQLRRTSIGPFEVRDAVAPPPRGQPWRHPPLLALADALHAAAQASPTRAPARRPGAGRRGRLGP